MRRSRLQIWQTVAEIMALSLLLLPGAYRWEFWEYAEAFDADFVSKSKPASFITLARANAPVLGGVVVLLSLWGVLMLITSMMWAQQERRVRVLGHPLWGVLRVAVLGIVVYVSKLSCERNAQGYEAELTLMFWCYVVFLSLTIAICAVRGVLSLLRRKNAPKMAERT